MQVINRIAIILKPKKIFLEWLNGLPDSEKMTLTLEQIRENGTAYLIPDYDEDERKVEAYIKRVYPDLFAEQLWSWSTNEDWWPENRDLQTFRKWFDVEIHSMVVDLVDKRIVKEDM